MVPLAARRYRAVRRNPPKKYQDIFPFEFESDDWRGLWQELAGVIRFWRRRGTDIPRGQSAYQAVSVLGMGDHRTEARISGRDFLAEAFTRPKVMHRLAKLGFTESYTILRLAQHQARAGRIFTELTQGPGANTSGPTLAEHSGHSHRILQFGGRPGLHRACGPRCDARGELRHLRACVRTDRGDPRDPGPRNTSTAKSQIPPGIWRRRTACPT